MGRVDSFSGFQVLRVSEGGFLVGLWAQQASEVTKLSRY